MPEYRGPSAEDRGPADERKHPKFREPIIEDRTSNLGPRTSSPQGAAIDVSRASKIYRRFSHRKQFATLKSALRSRSLIKNLKPDETFTALNDVTLTVAKGQTLGVIGRNGSGKSTLLKLVAGISKPSIGTVKVRGRI